MQYRIHIIKFHEHFWSFHTPVLQYPQLPVRTLFQNSLVSGIDDMLEAVHKKYKSFDVILSDEEIECESWEYIKMTWTRGDRFESTKGGNWYKNEEGKEGWLCSVLFDYFTPCPLTLFVYAVKPVKKAARVTFKQRLVELYAFTKKNGYGELIPIDETDELTIENTK